MSSTDTQHRQHAWSRYWSSGALHSCVGSFDGNYDGSIAARWRAEFAEWPKQARALEIGAGNGALAQLFLDSGGATAELDAVDLAAIAPDWLQSRAPEQRARVRFHSGLRAESLPFADASFDAAISQYGFEYTQLDAAVAELRRVLKPEARIALLLHHAESRLIEVARCEQTQYAALLQAGGMLDLARTLLPYFERARSPQGRQQLAGDPEAQRLRSAFNAAQQHLDRLQQEARAPALLDEARRTVAAIIAAVGYGQLGDAESRLDALRGDLQDGQLRGRELIECALDAAAIDRLNEGLCAGSSRGGRVDTVRHGNGHLLGWWLQIS